MVPTSTTKPSLRSSGSASRTRSRSHTTKPGSGRNAIAGSALADEATSGFMVVATVSMASKVVGNSAHSVRPHHWLAHQLTTEQVAASPTATTRSSQVTPLADRAPKIASASASVAPAGETSRTSGDTAKPASTSACSTTSPKRSDVAVFQTTIARLGLPTAEANIRDSSSNAPNPTRTSTLRFWKLIS